MNRIVTLLLLFAFNVAVAQDSTCFDWGGNVNIGIESGKFNQKQSLSYLSSAYVKGLKSWNNNELQWNIHLALLGSPNFVQRNIDSIGVIPFFHQPIYHSNKSAILLLPELSYKRKIGKYFIYFLLFSGY